MKDAGNVTSANRDSYAAEAMPYLPSLLQLLDRDPTSPTFGCFDRSYWHFRTMDFPSGMSQEFALPLALVYAHDFPENTFKGSERVKSWVLGAIDFARRSSHKDGSCDDYYPYERALGATVYSLYALAESYAMVGADAPLARDFLVHRARFVATHGETGVLSNHHAIAAAALAATARISGDSSLLESARRKAAEVLEHQHAEGWFQEYEGFDPGYQTVTVDFLARYWKATNDQTVLPALERAVNLLEMVQHPDGTFGGEYASRNTYHAQPHGFEILAGRFPAARRIADRLLVAFAEGRRARNDDDRLLGHHIYPCLLAWLDFHPRTIEPTPPLPARNLLKAAGFLVDRGPGEFLIAGLSKGGPFRAYRGRDLVANDSGPVLTLEDGAILVTHLAHDTHFEDWEGKVTVRGHFHRAKRELMTPFKLIVLRVIMLTIGRFSRNLVRRLLQKRLILGRDPSPFSFIRIFERTSSGLTVTDILEAAPSAPRVRSVHLSSGKTSIYIAVSAPWEAGWLLPFPERNEAAAALNDKASATIQRTL